jgi:hypothetical protein
MLSFIHFNTCGHVFVWSCVDVLAVIVPCEFGRVTIVKLNSWSPTFKNCLNRSLNLSISWTTTTPWNLGGSSRPADQTFNRNPTTKLTRSLIAAVAHASTIYTFEIHEGANGTGATLATLTADQINTTVGAVVPWEVPRPRPAYLSYQEALGCFTAFSVFRIPIRSAAYQSVTYARLGRVSARSRIHSRRRRNARNRSS